MMITKKKMPVLPVPALHWLLFDFSKMPDKRNNIPEKNKSGRDFFSTTLIV